MGLEELNHLDLWEGLVNEGAESSLELLVLMVLNCDITVVRGRRSDLHVGPKVDIVEPTVFILTKESVTPLTFTCSRVFVVEHVQVAVPRGTDETVLIIRSPVNDTRDIFFLLITGASAFRSGTISLVVLRLLEPLLLHTVFDVEAVASTALIADKELAKAVIQAHACDVCVGDISEHVL